MRLKYWFDLGYLGILIFIGFGDSFLPKPLSTHSKNIREEIHQTIISWVSDDHKKDSEDLIENPIIKEKVILESPDNFFERALEEAENQTNTNQ